MKKNALFSCAAAMVILFVAACSMPLSERQFVDSITQILSVDEEEFYASDSYIDSIFVRISSNPQSLDFALDGLNKLRDRMRVTTSDDGNIRAFCIDRRGSDYSPYLSYNNTKFLIIQFRSGESVYCRKVGATKGEVVRIAKIDGEGFYLFENYYAENAAEKKGFNYNVRLTVWQLDDDLHQLEKAFFTLDEGQPEIKISWDEYGWDRYGEIYYTRDDIFDESGSAIQFYASNGNLFVPKPKHSTVTDFYYYYEWQETNRFLNKSISAPFEMKNDDYYIRVEQQPDGSCIYKSWNGGIKQGEPNLVVNDSRKKFIDYGNYCTDYDKWITDDNSLPMGEKYMFYNDGYRYEVFYSPDADNELLVYDADNELIYSGILDEVDSI